MAGPFYKNRPMEYVPTYAPINLEAFAKAAAGTQERYDTLISAMDQMQILAANLDLHTNAQWVADEAIDGVNADIDGIVENQRVLDSGYLLRETYKRRLATNKDLIWAQKQSVKMREAEKRKMDLGALALDYNPTEKFFPVVKNEDGTKTYNDFTSGVEKDTTPEQEALKQSYFDDVEMSGYERQMLSKDKLWLLTEGRLTNKPAIKDLIGKAWIRYQGSTLYDAEFKKRKSPLYGGIDPATGEQKTDEQVNAEILKSIEAVAEEFMQERNSDTQTANPYAEMMIRDDLKKKGGVTENGLTILPELSLHSGAQTSKTLRLATPSVKPFKGKLKYEDGRLSKLELGWPTIRPSMPTDPLATAGNFLHGNLGIGQKGRLFSKYLGLNSIEQKVFNNAKEILHSQHPEFTEDQLMEATVDLFNDDRGIFPEGNMYHPYSFDTKHGDVEGAYVHNPTKANDEFHLLNAAELLFYDPTSETLTNPGSKFIPQVFEKGRDRRGRRIDSGPIENMRLIGELWPEETSAYPFNGAYVWKVTMTDGSQSTVISEYENRSGKGTYEHFEGIASPILFNEKTYGQRIEGIGFGTVPSGYLMKEADGNLVLLLDDGNEISAKDEVNALSDDGRMVPIPPLQSLFLQLKDMYPELKKIYEAENRRGVAEE